MPKPNRTTPHNFDYDPRFDKGGCYHDEANPPKRKRPNPKAAILASANAAVHLTKIGMQVVVKLDDGTELPTVIRSFPWQLGHGAWVVKLGGRSGGYDCARVRPA